MLHSGPGGGEVTKLMDLQRQFKNYQTYAEFRDSDPEFVKDVVAALVEHKKEKATSGRPHRGAHANDVTTTCKNIEDEVHSVGLYVTVCLTFIPAAQQPSTALRNSYYYDCSTKRPLTPQQAVLCRRQCGYQFHRVRARHVTRRLWDKVRGVCSSGN